MPISSFSPRRLVILLAAAFLLVTAPFSAQAQDNKKSLSDTDASPWGIASSASSSRTYADWLPKMSAVGVTWARMFPDWASFEPQQGQWNLDAADKMLDAAEANNIHLSGMLVYSPKWAIPPGAKGAAFPMNHLDDWSEYAGKVVDKYKDRVHYWEVWNEPNGSFKGHYADGHFDTTTDYATLAADAYTAAKKSDPTAQVGLSVASYDAPFLDQAILAEAKMGKPESFDYLCIHPYETTGGLAEADGEIPYLWMTKMLRDMLKVDAPDKANAEIWITEIGRHIGNKKESNESDEVDEAVAAKTLVKTYIMAIAQGIQRVCWFEAQDPHGEPPGYGLLDINGKPRASATAMNGMTILLGENPKYLGWLALGDGGKGYGFVFQGSRGTVLVAWMPLGETDKTITISGATEAFDPLGSISQYYVHEGKTGAARQITLTDSPLLITFPPADLVTQAQANASKNFPWGGDFSTATVASIELGAPNVNQGLIQVERGWTTPYKFDDGSTGAQVSPPGKHDNQAIKFIVHPSFANLKTHDYYVRVTARRTTPPKGPESYCKMDLVYQVADSRGGGPMRIAGRDMSGPDITTYKGETKGEEFVLADDAAKWQTHTWHLTDACFSKTWNYDLAFLIDQSDPFVIGKVEVSTQPFAN